VETYGRPSACLEGQRKKPVCRYRWRLSFQGAAVSAFGSPDPHDRKICVKGEVDEIKPEAAHYCQHNGGTL